LNAEFFGWCLDSQKLAYLRQSQTSIAFKVLEKHKMNSVNRDLRQKVEGAFTKVKMLTGHGGRIL